ncbi:MAG: hypothetical protein KGL41_06360 [Actinomycetales bacterium]|nr:hypothetical protein [Actinomycetales bacterium]
MNPNPIIYSGLETVGIVFQVLFFAIFAGLIGAVFQIAFATRRTARATEQLAAQVAEIKAHLSNDQS